MYTKQVPFKDFRGKPRTMEVNFNLTEREVFKLLVEFKAIFGWLERINTGVDMALDPTEVVTYYNNFEEILLSAYGEPSEDGLYFHKGARRYDFEESAAFAAIMLECVKAPEETSKMIDGLMPKDLQDLVKAADQSLAEIASSDTASDELKRKIAELQSQLAEQSAG